MSRQPHNARQSGTASRVLRKGLGALLLTAALTQGCAVVKPLAAPELRIERAAEAGDFRRALALIEQHELQPAPEWAERRAALEARAEAAAAEALDRARAASAKGAVATALEILETAEQRLPPDQERKEFMQRLERQRQVGLATLERRHQILEARLLAERLRLLEGMRPLARDNEQLPDDPEQLAERAQPLARTLDQYAARARRQEALELLQLAQELAPETGRADRIARLEQEPRAAAPAQSKARPPLSAVNTRLREALETDDLLAAAEWCRDDGTTDAAASAADPATAETYHVLCDEWRERRNARVETLLQEGRGHYSAGRIQEALECWGRGLELAPGHSELRAARQRARRVIERLESLRVPNPEEDDASTGEDFLGNGPGAPIVP